MIFDQRGSGRSAPLGETQDNSPDHLVDDIERLRQELGIARWVVFGGSWGSTLAMHYAETHPERVRGLIQKKIDGEEITSADDGDQPRAQVIDLMEALKASLASPKKGKSTSASKLPIKVEADRKAAKAAPRTAAARAKSR